MIFYVFHVNDYDLIIVKNADKDRDQPSQIKKTTVAPAEKKTITFEENYNEEELDDFDNVDMHHTIGKMNFSLKSFHD